MDYNKRETELFWSEAGKFFSKLNHMKISHLKIYPLQIYFHMCEMTIFQYYYI